MSFKEKFIVAMLMTLGIALWVLFPRYMILALCIAVMIVGTFILIKVVGTLVGEYISWAMHRKDDQS